MSSIIDYYTEHIDPHRFYGEYESCRIHYAGYVLIENFLGRRTILISLNPGEYKSQVGGIRVCTENSSGKMSMKSSFEQYTLYRWI